MNEDNYHITSSCYVDNNYLQFSGNNPFGTQTKLLFHLDRLNSFIIDHNSKPIFCEINLTNVCNLKCAWCISSNYSNSEKPILTSKILSKFFREFKNYGGKAITFSGGGEPMMHPEFEDIVNIAYDTGLELGLMTNGTKGNQKLWSNIADKFMWVRISLDTIDSDLYKRWKGTNGVQKVLDNIRMLKDYKCKVGVNCNVNMEMLVSDIQMFITILYDDVDYLQFRPVLPRYFNDKDKVNFNKKVWDYLLSTYKGSHKINLSLDKYNDIQYYSHNILEQFPFNSCVAHNFSFVLDSNGDIKVCMYHPNDDRFVFGNIVESSFQEIWESDKREKVKQLCNNNNLDFIKECQMCCKLWEMNKLLNFISKEHQRLDKNFL